MVIVIAKCYMHSFGRKRSFLLKRLSLVSVQPSAVVVVVFLQRPLDREASFDEQPTAQMGEEVAWLF